MPDPGAGGFKPSQPVQPAVRTRVVRSLAHVLLVNTCLLAALPNWSVQDQGAAQARRAGPRSRLLAALGHRHRRGAAGHGGGDDQDQAVTIAGSADVAVVLAIAAAPLRGLPPVPVATVHGAILVPTRGGRPSSQESSTPSGRRQRRSAYAPRRRRRPVGSPLTSTARRRTCRWSKDGGERVRSSILIG